MRRTWHSGAKAHEDEDAEGDVGTGHDAQQEDLAGGRLALAGAHPDQRVERGGTNDHLRLGGLWRLWSCGGRDFGVMLLLLHAMMDRVSYQERH